MTYQVLALKYRPQSFDEIIGQETITQTLKNVIAQKRLHHAYLFTGPRGVGKTSLARIFSKALNCEQGPTLTPCQECIPCREITESRSLDVQEIDGASHTSVEDIRTLRENIRYTPGTGHYRIYIIDEVHMLSKSAFAALLKTLEEPPEHAVFIFATTDPEKIPATILSRVLRFDFRRPSVRLLADHLQKVTAEEGIVIDSEGLLWIARTAEGSVRDALSLLDRLTSFAEDKIQTDQVLQILGVTGRVAIFSLLEKILTHETEEALKQAQNIYDQGTDLKQFGHELLEAIRDLLFFKVIGGDGFDDLSEVEIETMQTLSSKSEIPDLEYLFHLFHHAYQEIVRSTLPKVLLEIAILRMCTRAERVAITDVLEKLENWQGESGVSLQPATLSVEKKPPSPTPSRTPTSTTKSFEGFLKLVEKRKPSLAPIVARAAFNGEQAGHIELVYPTNPAYAEMLRDADRQALVFDLGKEYFGKEITWAKAPDKTPATEVAGESVVPASIVEEAKSIFRPAQTTVQGARKPT